MCTGLEMLIEQHPLTHKHAYFWSLKLVSCKRNSAPVDSACAGAGNHSKVPVASMGAGLNKLISDTMSRGSQWIQVKAQE